ncbi:fumarylacetoacetate hydrolase [Amycolatopsis sp. AA4]|uniref:fumarylacetoacetate hydrolase family protein n=1 Tax=Actinomycetes TaxID=1760 RepID=UPI0001B5757D|nr:MULTISPECIES: fumarylacetoacetate hydrolase family protein [Actinomycetes]ATY12818.1 fumarylacetoacetate hydrolase [Amycolatopsis sp. AA4]EFL08644.1 fumarylacetoacetate hydrolase [Streptomyces sp. AA4]
MRRLAKTAAGWRVTDGESTGALPPGTTLGSLLARPATEFATALAIELTPGEPGDLRAPVDDDTEVWAAGVTYEVSREARMEESGDADVYARVYEAERPELFFKSVGHRVRGPGEPIGVREDSAWDVPEPELALVCNAFGEIVGYTIVNDVSSRSIEGENPLYLPQAKTYRGSCAAGPWIVPANEVPDPYALGIAVSIHRAGALLWSGETSTARLHRRLTELVGWLYRGDVFPRGAVLATGTSAVPGPDVTLEADDEVTIMIEGIGTLRNPVRRGRSA